MCVSYDLEVGEKSYFDDKLCFTVSKNVAHSFLDTYGRIRYDMNDKNDPSTHFIFPCPHYIPHFG